jgi:hypothetical protein
LITSGSKLTANISYWDHYSKENVGLQYEYHFIDKSKSVMVQIIITVCFVFAILIFFAVKTFIKKRKLNH